MYLGKYYIGEGWEGSYTVWRERKKWKIVPKRMEGKIAPREECINMDGKNVFLCIKIEGMGLKIVQRKGEMPLSWEVEGRDLIKGTGNNRNLKLRWPTGKVTKC